MRHVGTADVGDFDADDTFSISDSSSRDTDDDRRYDSPVIVDYEYDQWIFNKSLRHQDFEESFVTYTRHPDRQHWLKIKCLYRDFEPGSLEANLMRLECPRAKSTACMQEPMVTEHASSSHLWVCIR